MKWISIIRRDNIPLSKHTVVCERPHYWPPGYATLSRLWQNGLVNPCLVPTTPALPRPSGSKCLAEGRNIIPPDEVAQFNEMDTVNTTKINNVCWH